MDPRLASLTDIRFLPISPFQGKRIFASCIAASRYKAEQSHAESPMAALDTATSIGFDLSMFISV
jgi:hypothetical protein